MNIRALTKSDIPICVEIFKLNRPLEGWDDYPVESLISELNAMFEKNVFCIPKYYVAEIDSEVATKKVWHLERFGFKRVLSRGGGYYLMQLSFEDLKTN
jgi:hypothetical protein